MSIGGGLMIRQVPVTVVRRDLDQLVVEVRHRKARVVIMKGGQPVAALIDMKLFERLRKLDEEFDQLCAALAKSFAPVGLARSGALLAAAVKATRRKRAHK